MCHIGQGILRMYGYEVLIPYFNANEESYTIRAK